MPLKKRVAMYHFHY